MMKLLICSIFIVLQASVYAQTISAAVYDIPPWGSREINSGQVIGIQKEIISILSEDIGIPIEIKLLPYKRAMASLLSGDSDFGIFYRNEEQDEQLIPLVRWGELDIIVLPTKTVKINDFSSLAGLQVGVRLGGKFNERFDASTKILKRSCLNYSKCVELLKNGRVDAIIGTAATLFYEIESQGLSVEEFGSPFYIGVKEDWLHFSRSSKNQDLMDKLKVSVEKNIENGNFGRAFSKFLPDKWKHH